MLSDALYLLLCCVVMLSVFMLSRIMQGVFMLNVITLMVALYLLQ
jgi:hypothetical protein